jgi:hypothetical protein
MSSRWNVTNANMHTKFLCSIVDIPDNSNLLIPISSLRFETKYLVLSEVFMFCAQETRDRRFADLHISAENSRIICEYVTCSSLQTEVEEINEIMNCYTDNILFSNNFIFDTIILKLKPQFSIYTSTRLPRST